MGGWLLFDGLGAMEKNIIVYCFKG